MRYPLLAALVLMTCVGCKSTPIHPVYRNESVIPGYGTGKTPALAKKAAHDDAMSRVEKLGYKSPTVRVIREDYSAQGTEGFDAEVFIGVSHHQ